MSGVTSVDQNGYTRNTTGTTDPAGSFATPKRAEPAVSLAIRPTAPAPRPSELWGQLSREEWRANAKHLQITMAVYKSRFESSFRMLDEYETENGTWRQPTVPTFFAENLETMIGVPAIDFPPSSWEEIRAEVICRKDGRPAVKIFCNVGVDDRCDDELCDHGDCPDTMINALEARPGFIAPYGDRNTRPHVLFDFANSERTPVAAKYFSVNALAASAKYRNGIAESVAAGGPFWFR